MIYGIVYMYKNQIDGKVYIGQTTQTIYRRRRDHFQLAFSSKKLRNDHFHSALRKYGRETFEETVLCMCADKEALDKAEQYFIEKLGATDTSKGYNLKTGGGNGKHTEETKRKISEASKRHWADPAYRKLQSRDYRDTSGLKTKEAIEKSAAAKRGIPARPDQIKNLSVKWGKR